MEIIRGNLLFGPKIKNRQEGVICDRELNSETKNLPDPLSYDYTAKESRSSSPAPSMATVSRVMHSDEQETSLTFHTRERTILMLDLRTDLQKQVNKISA